MHLIDHAYFLAAVVLMPVVGFISFRRLMRRVAAGETVDPMHLYGTTALVQWTLFVILAVTWIALERPFAALGFTLALDVRLLAGVALTIVAVALLLKHGRRIRETSTP